MNKPTTYGDVTVSLDGKDYTVRLGTLEFRRLEEAFSVKGVVECLTAGNASVANGAKFYKMALSRHHPSLTEDEVSDLRDYRPPDGGPTLEDAVMAAVEFAYPKLFEPLKGEPDPNATAAPSSELKTS